MVGETDKRRNWGGVLLALAFIAAAIGCAYRAWGQDRGWGWVAATVTLGLIGTVGFDRDVRKVRRDAKGRPVPEVSTP